jgi:HAD superfamily hydrolase (TIGR01509 family)
MKGILFDFDGTLVDSQHFYNIALAKILSRFDSIYSVEYCTKLFDGKCWNDVFEMLAVKEGFDKDLVFNEALGCAYELIESGARATNGTVEVLIALQEFGVKYAICSNSHTSEIESVLRITGLDVFFDKKNVFGRDMVNKGKPASDIYLLGLERMGFGRKDCVAVEDSVNGVMASVNAGIETVVFAGGTGFVMGFSKIERFLNEFGEIGFIKDMRGIVGYL